MPSRHFLFVVGAGVLWQRLPVGAKLDSHSVDVAAVLAAINDGEGNPIEITSNQWQFLRGVYAMNPEAAQGLPRGDNAVLLQNGGDPSGVLFFFGCDTAAPPVRAAPALLSLMRQIDKKPDLTQADMYV